MWTQTSEGSFVPGGCLLRYVLGPPWCVDLQVEMCLGFLFFLGAPSWPPTLNPPASAPQVQELQREPACPMGTFPPLCSLLVSRLFRGEVIALETASNGLVTYGFTISV